MMFDRYFSRSSCTEDFSLKPNTQPRISLEEPLHVLGLICNNKGPKGLGMLSEGAESAVNGNKKGHSLVETAGTWLKTWIT